ncbi:hypothetical protein Goklo_016149, partial [Gossypium klotzschianum]|nr:hypothetical protein [Gossypium klotzschianum]
DGFQRSTFTSSSPIPKAVVDELLKSQVVGPLVAQLRNTNQDVAIEAVIALKNFLSINNYLCLEHSKLIIKFESVPLLMKLLISGDKNTHPRILALICYIAQHDNNRNVLIKAGALTALQKIAPKVNTEHTKLETLVLHTISTLQSNLTVEQQQTDSLKGIIQFIIEQSKVVVDTIRGRLKLLYKGHPVYLPRLTGMGPMSDGSVWLYAETNNMFN